MKYEHIPVMPEEVIQGLNIKPNGLYVDGTLGGGGHARLIAEKLTTGKLIGIDRDAAALQAAAENLRLFPNRFEAARGNFFAMRQLLQERNITVIDGVLLDLGVSSHQLDEPSRGFSYRNDARLDMRMDHRQLASAYEVVNEYPEKRLTEIIFNYGEERYARKIARAIIKTRAAAPIATTARLAELIERAIPPEARYKKNAGHPAKRTFQALRIEVNGELDGLDAALLDIIHLLAPGGRVCVITFHSLEDRIVKTCFKKAADPCECPRDIPYCVCGKKPLLRLVSRKAVLPGEAELARNNRSHSAKLRIAERTDEI